MVRDENLIKKVINWSFYLEDVCLEDKQTMQKIDKVRQSKMVNQLDSLGVDMIQNADDWQKSAALNMGAVFHHLADLGFVEGEKLMGVEIFVSSEQENKFVVDRCGHIEDVRLPREVSGDRDTEQYGVARATLNLAWEWGNRSIT